MRDFMVFELLSQGSYNRRYTKAVGKREIHYTKLNRLKKRYEIHDRIRELGKEEVKKCLLLVPEQPVAFYQEEQHGTDRRADPIL